MGTNENNPFLKTKLFRSEKDQKRINEEKETAQSARVHISLGIEYGWYSQNTADERGFYEEYYNGDDQIVAVTHVLPSPTSERPTIDAKFIGTIKQHKRRVSTDGEELLGIRVVYGNRNETLVDPKIDTLSLLASYLGAQNDHLVRIEEDGQTVYQGTVSRGHRVLDRSKRYTIIFEAPAKPVVAPMPPAPPAPPALVSLTVIGGTPRSFSATATLATLLREMNTDSVQYKASSKSGRNYEGYENYTVGDFKNDLTLLPSYLIQGLGAGWAVHGTNLGAHLTRHGLNKSGRYTFNGVEIADPNHFPIERPGTLGQLANPVALPLAAPVYAPAPPAPAAYVDAAMKRVMTATDATPAPSTFGRKVDWQGEIHTDKASWEKSISALYRQYRTTNRFSKILVRGASAEFRTRAGRRGFDDNDVVVYMSEGGNNHVICHYDDWREILGVDL